MFQIARGSGATLSECTFSSKKRTSPKNFNEQSEQLQDKILQLLVPISKRLGGYNQMDVLFSKKHSPLEDLKKRYKVSLQNALG